MNIKIKDEQGLGLVLKMAGYSQEDRIWARDAIRDQFEDTAKMVFQIVLGRPLPDEIEVNTALSANEELDGEKWATLASYNLELSEADSPVFTVREISVKRLLEKKDIKSFEGMTIHEMFHAADQSMLNDDYQLFQMVYSRIDGRPDYFGQNPDNQLLALLQILRMFNHYRAEGLAVLGECLLMQSLIFYVENPIKSFRDNFLQTVAESLNRVDGLHKKYDPSEMIKDAYKDAPLILLLILERRGDINEELAHKAKVAIGYGTFSLSGEEVRTIMQAALSLSLTGFIEGLMLLGDEVAPIMPFLILCYKLKPRSQESDDSNTNSIVQYMQQQIQEKFDEKNANAFARLVEEPETAEIFTNAMDQIMGCCISEKELDVLYMDFCNNTMDNSSYPKMKEKLSILYSIFKTDANCARKRLAQWALTYFFDDEDIIHDDISGIGFVDDMMVIDYALKLL